MLIEPLRADDELVSRAITFRQGGAAIEMLADYLAGVDTLIVRRTDGDPLMIPSPQLWLRISALLQENSRLSKAVEVGQ